VVKEPKRNKISRVFEIGKCERLDLAISKLFWSEGSPFGVSFLLEDRI